MPQKSREQRTKVALRQGRTTGIMSSDVGLAAGLSTHAAKKSRHVEGERHPAERHVSRKSPPNSRGRKPASELEPLMKPGVSMAFGSAGRVPGFERARAVEHELSSRAPMMKLKK